MTLQRTVNAVCALILLLSGSQGWAAQPVKENTCKSKWTLNTTQQLAFGAFSIESGSGTLQMDSSGAIITSGAITSASSDPITTWTVTATNSLGDGCGAFPFNLSVVTTPLAGPGNAMPLSNIMVSSPQIPAIASPTPLPVLISTTPTVNFTLTLHGDLTANSPQAAGLYSSDSTLDLTQSGTPTSAITTATATSLSTLTLTETVPMNFGTVAGASGASTVIMETTGARSVTGGAQLLATGPGNAATFQVSGQSSLSYVVSITGPAVLESAGGQQITANNFTHDSSGVLPVGGTDTFNVGATLNLGPLQPAGSYSTAIGGGTPYTVTVNFN